MKDHGARNLQSWTFGASSTSIGAGLSSMMMSVTSLFCGCCCEVSVYKDGTV